MMKQLSIFIFSLSFFAISCENDNIHQNLVSIDTKTRKTIVFSEIFNDYEFVKLETTDSSLIGYIDKLVVTDKHLFVSSRKSIFIFDINGKFNTRINKYGKGSGEYLSLTDFIVDKDGNINILDRVGMKILSYTFNGNFLKEIKNKDLFLAESFTELQNNIIGVFGDVSWAGNYRMKILNLNNNKILSKHFKIKPLYRKYQHVSGNNNFIKNSLATYCTYAFNDTIFKLNSDFSIEPAYIIEHRFPIPENFYTKEYNDIRDFGEKAYRYNYYNSSLLLNDRLLYFTFKGKGKKFNRFATFYFLKTQKTYTTNEYIDDLCGNIHLFLNKGFNARAIYDNKLYFTIAPVNFLDWFGKTSTKNNLNKHEREILDLLKITKPQDNPIILIAELK